MNRIIRFVLQLAPVFLVVQMSGVVLVYGKKARKGNQQTGKGLKKARKGFCHAKANRDKHRCKHVVSSKGGNKGSSKVTYEGTISLQDKPPGLDYYPVGMMILGDWTSEPINAKNTVSLCDCTTDEDIVPGELDGDLSFELGDKSSGNIGLMGFKVMRYIPSAKAMLKDEGGNSYFETDCFQIGTDSRRLGY